MHATNWAGNYAYRASAIHAPSTIEELREIVSRAPRIRVLGSRHSFTDIADSGELVTLDRLPSEIEVGRDRRTVTCGGALRYGDLARALEPEGLALANLASLPHISVAGAVATATHGSGAENGNLATAVRAVELINSAGELLKVGAADAGFDGVVVGLGAVGAVTKVTLAVEPFYEARQKVFEPLPWETLYEHLETIMGSGYSVSVFTLWGQQAGRIWVKQRAGEELALDELAGVPAATEQRHPIDGIESVHATLQLGISGPWFERLPHFRMGFTPSAGAEIQSEYIVPRTHAVDAIEAIRGLAGTVSPLLEVSELRVVAADSLWMSPQYEQDTLAIHFTWRREQTAVERALEAVERALQPFGARPHWGKLFLADAPRLAPLYDRLPDFRELCERLDPRGAFRNDWLERHVLGPAT